MINPLTLPMLGGSLLAAVALGVHLGESSVGLIHPIHFQGPALHPRERGAAIDESRLPPRAPAYGELYGWEQGDAARAADCGNCEALQARAAYAQDYSAEVPYFGGPEEQARAADVRDAADAHVALVEELRGAEEIVRPKPPIARYAYYPVVAEEIAEPSKPQDDRGEDYSADDYYQ